MNLEFALIALIILLFSAILHEVAHGWIADRLGDPTARLQGRLTLNPIPHIDPLMSILLPLMLMFSGSPVIFGAAKPVPVDPFNLRDGKKDLAIVSLSGPLTNVLIAIIAALILRVLQTQVFSPLLFVFLNQVVTLNLLLAIFNLLPIPPLDGSKVVAQFLPDKEAAAYLSLSSVGFLIIFVLLLTPIGGFSLGQFIFSLVTFGQRLLGI